MSDAYIGQIELFAADAVPRGWAKCDGRLMRIAPNQPLFALIGTMYGGDGITQFALPDLRGRLPIGMSEQFAQGQRGGEEAHKLIVAEMPAHNHSLMTDATSTNTGNEPGGVLGQSSGNVTPGGPTFSANLYATGTPNATLNSAAIAATGAAQAHENRMPSLALSYCICVDVGIGLFPPQ